MSDKEYIAELERKLLTAESKIDAVRRTAKALWDTGVTAGLLGLQLYNDIQETPPERK